MTRRTTLALVSVAALLATGCGVSMPESGPVVETTTTASQSDDDAVNINPRRPGKDDTAEEIVRGFVEAMTATPAIRTSVAREFLTQDARATWQPTGTIIYAGSLTTSRAVGNLVEAQVTEASHTDARGAWLGALPAEEATLAFTMELEDDQWRISDPPDRLIVPQSWFEQRFRQVSLYFFDPSATLLVPEPVFVPRGRQFASTLVNGLLAGPSPELADTELNLLPAQLRSLVSVVSASGVAQVDLTSDTATDDLMPATTEAELLISQLAWILRQDPSISRFRITIGGRPVQLPNGEAEFSVTRGVEHAPYVADANGQLYGLLDGKMVGGSPQNLTPVSGPFGESDYGLRTVAADLRADRVAGVTASGASLLLGRVTASGEPVTQLIGDGVNLLDPAWDFRDRLWEIDRRPEGSVVHYLQGNRMRTLDVDGISGADVKDFLVSRDGSRLIAVLRSDGQNDAIVVSRILTSGNGRVVRALPAVNVTDPDDLDGQIRDIAWRSPTSIVVLHPVSRSLFQVRSATVDGAPTGADTVTITLGELVVSLVGTPVPDESGYAFIPGVDGLPGALVDLAGPRGNSIDIDPGVTSLGYVG